MNCRTARRQLLFVSEAEQSAAEVSEVAEVAGVAAHIEACESCRTWSVGEQRRREALPALRADLAAAQPSPDLERRLRLAFRTHQARTEVGPTSPWFVRHRLATVLAAAIPMGLAAFVLWRLSAPGLVSDAPSPAVSSVATVATASDQSDGFQWLRPGEDGGLEGAHVVRVSLDRSSLQAAGWADAIGGEWTSVEADVIVGYDGIARAIRIVR